MKLNQLHSVSNVLREYLKDLRGLCRSYKKPSVLTESKITITIDTEDGKVGLDQEAKNEFIQKAQELGKFDNREWVSGLIKSMEQAGVQGFHKMCEDEKPVTNKQIQQLIDMLVNLIGK